MRLYFAVLIIALFSTLALFAQWVKTNCPEGGDVFCFLSNGTDLFTGTWGAAIWKRSFTDILTGVEETTNNIPNKYSLLQNYPNPFNPGTKIKYEIPIARYVSLKFFDIMGRKINSLINKQQPADSYEVSFNVEELSNGIYFYQLKQGNYIKTRKMMLLK